MTNAAAGTGADPQVRRALLQIHFCVVLWGFTAILGKLISLPAFELVWWRMLIVTVAIALWPPVWRSLSRLDRGTWLRYAAAGVVVALHWLTFYGAIKLANASVAATCMALCPLMMAVVEPWIARSRFDARELLIGLLALPGVALVVGGTPPGMRAGIVAGTVSAALVVVFGSLNKRWVERADPLSMTWIELGAGTAFLTLVAPLAPGGGFAWPDGRDFALLVTLAIACTLLPFTLSLRALRHTSAFTAQLAVSLEPVYAVLLAIVLLGEQRELTLGFYGGVALIVGSVLVHTVMKLRGAR
ncbi:MAG: DMT family transporter [Steroidobacteraceae bacterium]